METKQRPKSEINLRKLMQKLGLGTNAFAEACGMSSQSMAQFLRNKSLTTASVYRIAMALDMDPRDISSQLTRKKRNYLLQKKIKRRKMKIEKTHNPPSAPPPSVLIVAQRFVWVCFFCPNIKNPTEASPHLCEKSVSHPL